ncbi:MAG: hypothetical protein MHM6MM_006703, partial [Cercozoa sp. M6MM]
MTSFEIEMPGPSSRMTGWTVAEAASWLASFATGKRYANLFYEHAVDGDILFTMSHEELLSMGITKESHRDTILSKIQSRGNKGRRKSRNRASSIGSASSPLVSSETPESPLSTSSTSPLRVRSHSRSRSVAYDRKLQVNRAGSTGSIGTTESARSAKLSRLQEYSSKLALPMMSTSELLERAAECQMSGTLHKRGTKFLNRRERRRFFVLHDEFLFWLKDKKSEFPVGRLLLTEPNLRVAVDGTVINIDTNKKTYVLRAPSELLAQSWYEAFRKVIDDNEARHLAASAPT